MQPNKMDAMSGHGERAGDDNETGESHWPPSSLLDEPWAIHGSKYLAKILLHRLQASPWSADSGEKTLQGLIKKRNPQKVTEFSTCALSTERIRWRQCVEMFKTRSFGAFLFFGAASSEDSRAIWAFAVSSSTLKSSTSFFTRDASLFEWPLI